MANVIELAKIYSAELDKALVAEAVTGFMELNSNLVQYHGGNEIKIPKMVVDGLGDYNRGGAVGFTPGSMNFSYETKTMTQDRARSYTIDRMDVDETNFAVTAAAYLGEVKSTRIVPEVDSYRISKLASTAITAGKVSYGYTPAADTILGKLKSDIAAVQDVIGDDKPLVVMMSIPALATLEQADNITRFLSVDTLKKGDIETRVKSLDGTPIVAVPSSRMKTAFVFNDATTAGQEEGGAVAAAGAKSVNWLIFPKKAPIAISKVGSIRIFTPEENQDSDAYKINMRNYHDLFILDNAVAGMKVCIKEAEV